MHKTTKNLTCIVCPMGCDLSIELTKGVVTSVKGHTCKKGEAYAISECTNPVRTLTTTILLSNGNVLPVKTNIPIPKEKMFECMQIINSTIIDLPVSIGDILIPNILNTGVDIVAAKNSYSTEYIDFANSFENIKEAAL